MSEMTERVFEMAENKAVAEEKKETFLVLHLFQLLLHCSSSETFVPELLKLSS